MLSEAGISRQRLESFDRPIVTLPEFFPDKRDALIRDCQNYLKILKSVSCCTLAHVGDACCCRVQRRA